jgi:hypothetical protein
MVLQLRLCTLKRANDHPNSSSNTTVTL